MVKQNNTISQMQEFQDALNAIRSEYLKTQAELKLLAQELAIIASDKTATLSIAFEQSPDHTEYNQESRETAEQLLQGTSHALTNIEAETERILKQVEQMAIASLKQREKVQAIANETQTIRERFRNYVLKFSAILLVAFAQQASERTKTTEIFADKDKAKIELREKGITNYRRGRYVPGVSELIFKGVKPIGYDTKGKLSDFLTNLVYERGGGGLQKNSDKQSINIFKIAMRDRSDAFSLYLGLPQKYNTFGISDYQPTNSKDNKYYYKINYLENIETDHELAASGEKPINWLLSFVRGNTDTPFGSTALLDNENYIMGTYKLSMGKDEHGYYISYYDSWDLGGSPEGTTGIIGQPFEIYDRIYYDPQTFEVIEPK